MAEGESLLHHWRGPRPNPEQDAAFEGWRGLVNIGREIAKGSEGNPLIVDSADILK
ncbi:hypothetical protein [Fulvimarina sp. MAC3]|uniref:hypothetical protein n=1 Tax=Fulvimarina sp. MAC3 TaxID=3148887 RepID=UPI0031FBCC03